jgi:hypothetical protein
LRPAPFDLFPDTSGSGRNGSDDVFIHGDMFDMPDDLFEMDDNDGVATEREGADIGSTGEFMEWDNNDDDGVDLFGF